jgi:tetratricopeptide (TPR) repeat protein
VQRIRAAVVCCSILIAFEGLTFSQQPSDLESLLASAKQAQARGDFEAAADDYRQAVKLQPEVAELRANLGLMHYQTGKNEQAAAAFLQALRLKPGLFVPNLFLGLDYIKLKRFHEAVPYLQRAALIKPADLETQLALGQAYAGTGKTGLAIASYLRVVQADSGNADGWFHLGVTYLDQVEANARILLARDKDSGYLHALAADTFAEQKAFIQAADAYKATLASPAFPAGMHGAYGLVLLNEHDLPGAEHELKAELASNPSSGTARLGLARLHLQQGAAVQAAKELAEIWKADPSFLRANAPLFKAGLPEASLSELQGALEKERANGGIPEPLVFLFQGGPTTPNTAGSSEDLNIGADSSGSAKKPAVNAQELYARGRYGECSDELSPRLPQLHASELRLLASCAYSTARYRAAFDAGQKLALNPATEAEGLYWETKSAQKLATETLAHASELDSNSPTLHVLLGDVYRQREHYQDAEQEYRKALAIQAANPGALFGLSLSLLGEGKNDEALTVAQAALATGPDDPEFNIVMGEILCARDDFAAAEPFLKKSLNAKPELVSRVHALLGKVYAQTDRTQQAIAELKLALASDKDGTIHYQIARLYLKVGDRDSAKKALSVSEQMRRNSLARAAVAMQQGAGDSE